MVKAADVKKADRAGGAHSELLPDAQGPSTTTYHNPLTGQEFHGLPMDPWSLESYMRGGVHGSRARLLPGPASEELRAKWESFKNEQEDPLNAAEYQTEAKDIVEELEDKARRVDTTLLALVEKLTQQVTELTARLDNSGIPVQPTPVEPKQLNMEIEVQPATETEV